MLGQTKGKHTTPVIPGPQEAEAGKGTERIQGQPELHRKFKAGLSYNARARLKSNINKQAHGETAQLAKRHLRPRLMI